MSQQLGEIFYPCPTSPSPTWARLHGTCSCTSPNQGRKQRGSLSSPPGLLLPLMEQKAPASTLKLPPLVFPPTEQEPPGLQQHQPENAASAPARLPLRERGGNFPLRNLDFLVYFGFGAAHRVPGGSRHLSVPWASIPGTSPRILCPCPLIPHGDRVLAQQPQPLVSLSQVTQLLQIIQQGKKGKYCSC